MRFIIDECTVLLLLNGCDLSIMRYFLYSMSNEV